MNTIVEQLSISSPRSFVTHSWDTAAQMMAPDWKREVESNSVGASRI